MKQPNLAPPVPRGILSQAFPTRHSGIHPADCSNGTLIVWTPTNPTPYKFSDQVACCGDWDCGPCHSYDSYRAWIQQHVAACAGDNINHCTWKRDCPN